MSNWQEIALGEITELLSGFAFKSAQFGDHEGLPVVRIRDVKRGYSETFFNGEFNPTYIVNDGDLLIGMDGEFNRETWSGGQALLNQRVCKLQADNKNLDQRYLYHFLPEALKEIERGTSFATVKHISAKQIRAISIPLPPLDEQRRIAAILDKADVLRTKRREAIAKLDTLVQSIFIDMFGDPVTNPMEWEIKPLGEICDVRDGTHDSPKYISEGGFPFLTTKNIQNGRLDLSAPNLITESDYEKFNRRSKVDKGDIIMPMIGTIGRPLLIDFEPRFAFKNMALIKFVSGSPVAQYVQTLLSGSFMQHLIQRQARGGTQAFVSLTILRNMQIPVPTFADQILFRERLATLDGQLRSSENHLLESNKLFASLQQRAFKGEL